MSNRARPAGAGATVQSVDRAGRILELLASSGESGVTEIAEALDVHKSTAFRLISALESRDLVEQNGERGKYRLGAGILRLAGATIARLDVVSEARPICRALAAQTGETVNLAVLSDGAVLYLDQVAGPTAVQLHNWVGQRVPVHATANGRVLLSGLVDDQVRRLVGDTLVQYTPATVSTPDELVTSLREIRRDGIAVAVDELEVGLTAVAAPVRSLHGDIIASVSVSGPSFRLSADGIDAVVLVVREASTQISARMGWLDR
ncbi:MAG: IclR family transcriptional regulator [Actinomycetes bacterium]